jgi:hypothetical protein
MIRVTKFKGFRTKWFNLSTSNNSAGQNGVMSSECYEEEGVSKQTTQFVSLSHSAQWYNLI